MSDRMKVDSEINELVEKIKLLVKENDDETSYLGLLNYTLTSIILYTIPKKKYWLIAGVTGVLQNIISEFYRRYVADYEDLKAEENGDLSW
jgi:hypothetical protein